MAGRDPRDLDSGADCVSRREFLASASAAPAVGMAAGFLDARAAARPTASSDVVGLDALDLSKRIHSKQLSCVEVMNAFLDHIERINPKVNAIVSLQARDGLLTQARERDAELRQGKSRGVLHGFPHAVKDLAATRGIRTSYGTPLLDSVPDEDELFVERLRAQGVVIIGKTNTPELGFGSQSYNPVFGTTLNAYDQTKCAGGSSGGAAVSLALRMVPLADGSDMMGSLRNPAAFNNVFGFRPSYGRVPSVDSELFLGTLSTDGPMARTVPDLAMLLSVMAGPDPRAPFSLDEDPRVFAGRLDREFRGVRVGWLGSYDGYLPMEPGVLDLCTKALRAFETVGCVVEEARPTMSPRALWPAWLTLRHWLSAAGLRGLYADPAKRAQMKPEIQWEIEGGLAIGADEVHAASRVRSDWYRALHDLFKKHDFLLLPSAQVFPFDANVHWPKEIAGKTMDTYHRWMEVVLAATLSGCPAISVPVGFGTAGVPMGMQIIGPRKKDFAVLQIARAYEQATRWTRDRPPALLKTA